MRVVVAVGGNALLERGERPDPLTEHLRVRATARALAPLGRARTLVICHGNGPHVGILAAQSESDPSLARPYPLDVIGAQTQGMLGYSLAQALRNLGVEPIVTVVTQTVIDPEDPAFADPVKAIGPVLTEEQAIDLTRERGWQLKPDTKGWRRVVASPRPRSVVEIETIRLLVEHHTSVVCGGGGGVPVTLHHQAVDGVEAVVDKDATAALLGIDLAADLLVILTDVDAVRADFGLPSERPLREITAAELSAMSFSAGSMGPKVAACLEFVNRTGNPARIGALKDAAAVLDGAAGTCVLPSGPPAGENRRATRRDRQPSR